MCDFIKKQFDLFKKNRILYIKENVILIPVFVTFVLCIFLIFNYSTEMIVATLTAFGFIFVALKYKLDRANYQKDLFEKRYKMLLIIIEVLADFEMNKVLTPKFEKDFLWCSHCLFSSETYQFIRKIWNAIHYLKVYDEIKEEIKSYPDNPSYKEFGEAKVFLSDLTKVEKLLDKFPELKLTIY